MVLRLLSAGHRVTVWNRTSVKLAPAVAAGARTAPTPAAVALECDVVLLCLFDASSVEQVVFGTQGVASISGVRTLVDHSSISPSATRRFSQRLNEQCGAQWVDAPVSGGTPGATAGMLTVMAGGSPEAIVAAEAPMRAYAARIVRVGDVGAGQTAKLCNQTIVGATLLAIAEAVALARDSDIDPAQLPEALAGGWADSKLLQLFVPRMISQPQEVIGSISTLLKDMDAIAALASDTGTPMPIGAAVLNALRFAVTMNLGGADLSKVVQLFHRQTEIGPDGLTG